MTHSAPFYRVTCSNYGSTRTRSSWRMTSRPLEILEKPYLLTLRNISVCTFADFTTSVEIPIIWVQFFQLQNKILFCLLHGGQIWRCLTHTKDWKTKDHCCGKGLKPLMKTPNKGNIQFFSLDSDVTTISQERECRCPGYQHGYDAQECDTVIIQFF